MVEKPTIPGYYKFRVGDIWYIDYFNINDKLMSMNGRGVVLFDNIDEIHGPIDPRPDILTMPTFLTPPDEVEALAEKLFVSGCLDDEKLTPRQIKEWPEWCFGYAEVFIKFRNARRKEQPK